MHLLMSGLILSQQFRKEHILNKVLVVLFEVPKANKNKRLIKSSQCF